MFASTYSGVFEGTEEWQSLTVPTGELFTWDPSSTYVKNPPYFTNMTRTAPESDRPDRERAGAAGAGRFDHHRPYLAGGIDQGEVAGRAVS